MFAGPDVFWSVINYAELEKLGICFLIFLYCCSSLDHLKFMPNGKVFGLVTMQHENKGSQTEPNSNGNKNIYLFTFF